MARTTPVIAEAIEGIFYDSMTRMLELKFSSGFKYRFFEVPYQVYRGLVRASSRRTYYWEFIRRKYQYQYAGEERKVLLEK